MGKVDGGGFGHAEGSGAFGTGMDFGFGNACGEGPELDDIGYGYGDRVGTGPFGCGDADGDGGIHGRGNG